MLLVVDRLAQNRDGVTFQELCDELDIPGASMYRLLSVLEAEQFILRHQDNRRYFLGPAASDVGLAARGGVSSVAHQLGDWLAGLTATQEDAALLTEFIDDTAVCTLRHGGGALEGLSADTGRPLPLHATAEARTLLIDMPRYKVTRLLAESEFTLYRTRTPRSVDEVVKRVALIRRYGYGVSYDEFDAGIWSLAAPVRNGAGRVVATVSVATTEARMGRPGVIDGLRKRVCEVALRMSADLGHTSARAA
ncbi:IclR family transcriptional regulator [Streptomyces massasporeus]